MRRLTGESGACRVSRIGLLSGALALVLSACAQGAPQTSGSRSFTTGIALEDSAATSANVSIGDVDGDGHPDILLVKGRHWPLHNLILLGDGTGAFQPPKRLGGEADRSYSGVLVDLDRDGDLDVVVSNDDPDTKVVHLNDGRGGFSVGSSFGRPEWSTRHLRVSDLDGDGLADAILANRHGPEGGPSFICFGVAPGRFQERCTAIAHGSATTIVPHDLDGDGAPDLVVPHRDGGQSFVYLNDGAGGFDTRRPFGPPDAHMRSALPVEWDGDGTLDLVAIDEATGPAVFYGRPDGTYSPGEPLGRSGARPYALAAADVDENGRTDAIVGYVEAPSIVVFNDGDGTFHTVRFGDDQGATYGFAVGDLNEDGLLDIAAARSGARNMLYLGSPAPTPGR
ncbi:MAG: VCBS repeat-containing protein [Gemmatimonadota bacterium]